MSQRQFDTIKKAIEYLDNNQPLQPSLAEVAAACQLSEYHFQRLFSQWAGISPKQFLQSLTRHHALERLLSGDDLQSASQAVGLSSASRLHDLFVHIDAVTPGEIKSGGLGLTFHYGIYESLLGWCFIAKTARGIHQLVFIDVPDKKEQALEDLRDNWPKASFVEDKQSIKNLAEGIFTPMPTPSSPLKLWVKGTEFQIKVWQALLRIPYGRLSSYSAIAALLEQPNASRAVGTAIGKNPVALLIPCHRVIQQTGKIGGYRWGIERKKALLAIESETN